jgi:dienelactone hydrolase
VVVLVHGSGPHDRDETVGGAKVFRDLAWGLASQGVGVLRYEKRTKTHGAKMGAGVTLEAEVIDDALAALELMRSHPAVDPGRIYLLGHSLGAQLAPEIARRDRRLAGVIMLAAPARPIAMLMKEQLEYLATQPQNTAPAAQAQIRTALAEIDRLSAGTAPDTAVILGAPVSYFRQLDAIDARATARSLDTPMLVLQGERDYQVTMRDFALWQAALDGREGVRLRSLPGLNHLFVSGTGPSTPVEYMQPGFVSPDVIAEIAGWIAR